MCGSGYLLKFFGLGSDSAQHTGKQNDVCWIEKIPVKKP